MHKLIHGISLLVLILAAVPVVGGSSLEQVEGMSNDALFPWATFDASIPTQEAVTGVKPGSRPLRHGEVLRYFEALAEASPRATLQTYAYSHEGRPLVLLAVSDEATIARLEAFRTAHARRLDPRGRGATDDKVAVDGAKAVAWMAYGIHGDELSSTDAAASLAFWLVAGEDDKAQALRDGLVILIDPMENPDGRERFLSQTAAFAHKVPNPDQDDLSHTTVWPWGRGNHYLFDLNRDWFTMVHPESARSEVLAGWNPQIALDCHEMGNDSTYLFTPPREPYNPLLPDYMRKWWGRFAGDQARALDRKGYSYYTGEWNEEFFPGYGSSWPAYLGALGILYEMSGTDGTLVRRQDGSVRTYGEAVEHQVISSVANLETLAANRQEFLDDFVSARRAAITSPKGPARAWLLPPGRSPQRTDALARLLTRQGIEVYRSEAAMNVSGLRDARTGQESSQDLPAGTWMVSLDQPASPLASVLLDPHVPMSAAALREERESIERGDGSRLYDTTAWSLPLLFGVESYWSTVKPAGSWSLESEPEGRAGEVESVPSAYGYLAETTDDAAMGALAALLEAGITVQAANKPFTIDGHAYDRGTLLIRREVNSDDLESQLVPIAERWALTFHATPTADSEEGPDLGGAHFETLRLPRVGILTGSPVSPTDYGSLWYVLDERAGLRFSGIDIGRLRFLDLQRYNVLVFPPAWGGAQAYRHALGEQGLAALKAWIEGGGTAIGIDGGAQFLADSGTELTKTRLRSQALTDFPPIMLGASALAVHDASPMRAQGWLGTSVSDSGVAPAIDVPSVLGAGARPFAPDSAHAELAPEGLEDWFAPVLPAGRIKPTEQETTEADARLRSFSPQGALLRVELATRHWMTWGLPDEIAVLLGASDTFVADGGVDVVARFPEPERIHLGGLLWPEAAGRLAHTAYAARERLGDGQVILFLGHPTFRAWPLDSQRMFLNALLYGPGLGTHWPRPW
ncbi:MAG: M14 family zinc carboxypeptidase [Thermoanaerobaculia bacterium]